MRYIDAKRLIELCLKENLFNLHEDKILLYRKEGRNSKEGWYATEKEDVIQILLKDKLGQDFLIRELKSKGIEFEN